MSDSRIRFVFDDSGTDHPTATVIVSTPWGTLQIMGDPTCQDRVVTVHGVHIQGLEPNRLGIGGLARIAQAFLEEIDAAELVVQGAIRTTGRAKGRTPRVFRYRRR